MGEQKRRAGQQTPYEKSLADLARGLTDEGKLIEAGWLGLRAVWVDPKAPDQQVSELRQAFMAGAQHLFTSIMQVLDPGEEPSAADLNRMSLIDAELRAFGEQLIVDLPVRGRA